MDKLFLNSQRSQRVKLLGGSKKSQRGFGVSSNKNLSRGFDLNDQNFLNQLHEKVEAQQLENDMSKEFSLKTKIQVSQKGDSKLDKLNPT